MKNSVADQSVDTANTVLLLINNKYAIGRAQSLSASRQYGTRGVYEIGSIMPQEHAFLRFTGTLDLNRIRLRKASLEHAGIVGLGEDILGTPTFSICTVDRYTGEVGITYNRCSAVNFNENYRTNDFIREEARFYFCSSSGKGRYAPIHQAPPTYDFPEAGLYNGN